MPDYYKILGVKPDAEAKDIKKAFNALMLQWHPDKIIGGETPESRKQFLMITEAKETLLNPKKREAYDKSNQNNSASNSQLSMFLNMDIEAKKEWLVNLPEDKFKAFNTMLVEGIMDGAISNQQQIRSATKAIDYVKEIHECVKAYIDMDDYDEKDELLSDFDDTAHLKHFETVFNHTVEPIMEETRIKISKMSDDDPDKHSLAAEIKQDELNLRSQLKNKIEEFSSRENISDDNLRSSGPTRG